MDSKDIFIDIDSFTFAEDEIESGNYAHVFTVKEKKTGKTYAAKELDASSYLTPKAQQTLIREVIILNKIRHPAIIEFKGFSFISFEDQSQWQPTIFTGFVENKTLYAIMENSYRGVSPQEWTLTKQYINLIGIASAMKYLHQNKILHRDLKPGNILLDKNFYPKICDFGLSRTYNEPLIKSQVGTQTYMAPEILEGNPYGPPVDVYSFAIMACEIMSKSKAYPEIENMDLKIMKRIVNGSLRPKFSPDVNPNFQELIKKCWDSDPLNRPSFNEIFSELTQKVDHYIEKVDKEEIENYINMLLKNKQDSKLDQNSNVEKTDEFILIEKVQSLEKRLSDEKKMYKQQIEDLKNQNTETVNNFETEKRQLQELIDLLNDEKKKFILEIENLKKQNVNKESNDAQENH